MTQRDGRAPHNSTASNHVEQREAFSAWLTTSYHTRLTA